MSSTYGPSAPAFTAARVTRAVKQTLGAVRVSTERGNGCMLTRVHVPQREEELRLLNLAASGLRAAGLTATVVSLGGTRGRAVTFRIKTTDPVQVQARMQQAEEAFTATLKAEGDAARAAQEPAPEPVIIERVSISREEALSALEPAAAELSYRGIRAGAYEVLHGGAVIGRVVRGPAAMSGATWTAYRPGGGQVTAGALSRQDAARALLPLSAELAQELRAAPQG